MPNSLRCRIKQLCHKGYIREVDRDRIIQALDLQRDFEQIQFVSGGRINGRGYAYKCGVHNTLTALLNEIRKLRDQCDLSCTDTFNTVLKTINKHLQEVEGK